MEAEPTRCDPHALAESKRTFDVAIAVAADGGEPLTVAVRPADVSVPQRLVEDVCRC